MELIPVITYGIFLTFILFYSFVELHLVFRYIFQRKKIINQHKSITEQPLNEFPFVTVQLPVYNEIYVVNDLIEVTTQLNYPKDKFEIQVLDDSTDESTEIIAKKIEELKEKGFLIHHIRRANRNGFKAGALAHGLETAKGEFIAIFDADFTPDKDFLLRTLPYFRNKKTGMVQTRWGHYNKNYSLITRLQAFALDAHFTLEQVGRNVSDSFINFNGTAGIWRKTCIVDGGGWQADTLTEDLDLSYRAQLKNWKFIYLEDVVSPAELPAEMNALKAQQFRWSKGAAECAKKNLGKVLKSKTISFGTKMHAIFHLLNSFLYICILAIGLMSLPVIYIVKYYPEHSALYSLFIIYYAGMLCITLFYFVSEVSVAKNKLLAALCFPLLFPLFLSISMGLSLYNGIGVLEGYRGKKSSFIRTPKFNIKTRKDHWRGNKYAIRKLPPVVFLEGLLFVFFALCISQVIILENYLSIPFFSLLTLGFGFVFLSSLLHILRS